MTAQIPVGPWRTAFDEAWASWCAGNFGIGAVLFDPEADEIVTRGRNRVEEQPGAPGQIAGNFMAHAEMNAFAVLRRRNARGLNLYTTLEPCPMCAATALMLRTARVSFAALDPLVSDAHTVWQHSAVTAERVPQRRGPLPGIASAFAAVLPATYTAVRWRDDPFLERFHQANPDLGPCAEQIAADGTLAAVRDGGGSVIDALDAVRHRLSAL